MLLKRYDERESLVTEDRKRAQKKGRKGEKSKCLKFLVNIWVKFLKSQLY